MNRLLILALALGSQALAQVPAHPDPYLPPAQRLPSGQRPAAGAELRAQAVEKLRERFEQADLDASGSLSKDEAQRAGLGFVVRHFDAIDRARRGKVSFEDLRAFLKKIGEQASLPPLQNDAVERRR